ncbi:ankyrin repeat domain-containing protein [Luteimonas sp. A649]
MHRAVPVLAAAAAMFVMVSCAAGPSSAKEDTRMSAVAKTPDTPFKDPAVRPIADAVASGDISRIRALAPTSDLAAHGEDDVTLLEWAIWNRQPEALAALLDAGADPSQPGMDGETVAHMAAMVDDARYLQVLIDHDAPVDIVGARGGRTPIFRAVLHRRDPQVAMLKTAGVDLQRQDSMGNGLLHVAASVNDAGRVLELLDAGVAPDAENSRGDTFQVALFAGSDARLNAQTRAARQEVREWLAARDIPQP